MRDYEIYPTDRDLFEYHGSTEIIRTRKLNRMDQSLKILIIDDDEHVLTNLCYFLNNKNYDVTKASDGLEGLRLFENDRQVNTFDKNTKKYQNFISLKMWNKSNINVFFYKFHKRGPF